MSGDLRQTIQTFETFLAQIEAAQESVDPDARHALSRLKNAFSQLEQRQQTAAADVAQPPAAEDLAASASTIHATIGDIDQRLEILQQRVDGIDPGAMELVTQSPAGQWLENLTTSGNDEDRNATDSRGLAAIHEDSKDITNNDRISDNGNGSVQGKG